MSESVLHNIVRCSITKELHIGELRFGGFIIKKKKELSATIVHNYSTISTNSFYRLQVSENFSHGVMVFVFQKGLASKLVILHLMWPIFGCGKFKNLYGKVSIRGCGLFFAICRWPILRKLFLNRIPHVYTL